MTNSDLAIPAQFRRSPGDPARHRGPTRSINARPSTAGPSPSKTLSNLATAERAAIETDLAAKADLAKHGKEGT